MCTAQPSCKCHTTPRMRNACSTHTHHVRGHQMTWKYWEPSENIRNDSEKWRQVKIGSNLGVHIFHSDYHDRTCAKWSPFLCDDLHIGLFHLMSIPPPPPTPQHTQMNSSWQILAKHVNPLDNRMFLGCTPWTTVLRIFPPGQMTEC